MKITTFDARGRYTKMLIAFYATRKRPTSFFRSFFSEVTSDTALMSIMVQRGTEKIAVEVELGTEGNRNKFSKETEKIFAPPYYKEYFDVTELDLYDKLFTEDEVDLASVEKFIVSVADKLSVLQDKIERAIERMCASVFEFGVITLKNGTIINYGRNSWSLIDGGSSTYWTDNDVDPYVQLTAWADLIRNNGLTSAVKFNLILGANALSALRNNPFFKAQQNFYNMKLDNVTPPKLISEVTGATIHGELSIGNYKAYIYTYGGTYDHPVTGVKTSYMNPDKAYLIPADQEGYVLGFGAVPQLTERKGLKTIGIVKGKYVPYDFIDERATTHVYGIKSRPLPVPVAIDTLVSAKVA